MTPQEEIYLLLRDRHGGSFRIIQSTNENLKEFNDYDIIFSGKDNLVLQRLMAQLSGDFCIVNLTKDTLLNNFVEQLHAAKTTLANNLEVQEFGPVKSSPTFPSTDSTDSEILPKRKRRVDKVVNVAEQFRERLMPSSDSEPEEFRPSEDEFQPSSELSSSSLDSEPPLKKQRCKVIQTPDRIRFDSNFEMTETPNPETTINENEAATLDATYCDTNFFDTLDLSFEIPSYLKKVLAYAGFDNLQSLSDFDESTDFASLSTFMIEDLSEIIAQSERKEYFGIYCNNIKKFRIPDGHKKLIVKLSKHCKAAMKLPRKKQKSTKSSTESSFRPSNSSEIDACDEGSNDTASNAEKQIEHIKKRVENYVKDFCSKNVDQADGENIVKRMATKKIQAKLISEDYKVVMATIQCFLCESKIKVHSAKIGTKWILSNFNRHFRKHFLKNTKSNSISLKPQAPLSQTNYTIESFFKRSTKQGPTSVGTNNEDADARERIEASTSASTKPLTSQAASSSTIPVVNIDSDQSNNNQDIIAKSLSDFEPDSNRIQTNRIKTE